MIRCSAIDHSFPFTANRVTLTPALQMRQSRRSLKLRTKFTTFSSLRLSHSTRMRSALGTCSVWSDRAFVCQILYTPQQHSHLELQVREHTGRQQATPSITDKLLLTHLTPDVVDSDLSCGLVAHDHVDSSPVLCQLPRCVKSNATGMEVCC